MSKYVAYVGSYTYIGKSKGITILDVDTETASMKKREEMEVHNSSHMVISPNQNYLYSIADEGIASFRIEADGSLTPIGISPIGGMRGHYLDIDPSGKFIAVAGYHDGKTTVMRLNEDGSVGQITDAMFDQGMGSIAERDSQPHISCVKFTPDGKYLYSVDLGLDHIKVFRFDHNSGKLTVAYILHCPVQSAPHQILFSKDGQYLYVISQMANTISLYKITEWSRQLQFDLLQTLPTVGKRSASSSMTKAVHLAFTSDEKHVLYTSAGDNCIGMFDRDPESGLLTYRFSLPVSGRYPKDFMLFPNEQHICSINYEECTLTFFALDYDRGLIIMNAAPIKIDQPTCGLLLALPEES